MFLRRRLCSRQVRPVWDCLSAAVCLSAPSMRPTWPRVLSSRIEFAVTVAAPAAPCPFLFLRVEQSLLRATPGQYCVASMCVCLFARTSTQTARRSACGTVDSTFKVLHLFISFQLHFQHTWLDYGEPSSISQNRYNRFACGRSSHQLFETTEASFRFIQP